MSIKINITKKRQKKEKKLKVNILYIIITFYRIFFRILFLFEETSKIKSVYGKQDYQPSAKIKTEKIKTVKKMVKNKAVCFVRLPICIHFYAVIAPYSNILTLTIRQMSNI